jgi:hypothetical protein
VYTRRSPLYPVVSVRGTRVFLAVRQCSPLYSYEPRFVTVVVRPVVVLVTAVGRFQAS